MVKRKAKDLADLEDRIQSKSKRIVSSARVKLNQAISMTTSSTWLMMEHPTFKIASLKNKTLLMTRKNKMKVNKMKKWRKVKRKSKNKRTRLFNKVNLKI